MKSSEFIDKTSQAEQDVKNAKTAIRISILAFIIIHALVFIIPAHAFPLWIDLINRKPAILIVHLAAVVWPIIVLRADLKDKNWATLSNIPWILMLVLAFTSAVIIGYHAYIVQNPN